MASDDTRATVARSVRAPLLARGRTWWRLWAVAAIGLGLLATQACERYTMRYQAFPAIEWLEALPPFASSATVPPARALLQAYQPALPGGNPAAQPRPFEPQFSSSLVQRSVSGVRDAAAVGMDASDVPGPENVGMAVLVFHHPRRAAAWTGLRGLELDFTREHAPGGPQLRLDGSGAPVRVWVNSPGTGDPRAVATALTHVGPIAAEARAWVQDPRGDGLAATARAEALARRTLTDWLAWLETQPFAEPSRG